MIEAIVLLLALIGILIDDNENRVNQLFVLAVFSVCAIGALKGI